jgi:Domain of unknown function (DUF5655)
MASRECYHCKQQVEEGEDHDCWTTTEAALTQDLSEDLRDAWERLRETAADFGEQRIYASHKSIMFSRRACYFFVRPKKQFLEVTVFLGRGLNGPQVRKVDKSSKAKTFSILHIRHRDEVEPPIIDWLREAYEFGGQPLPKAATVRREPKQTGKPVKARSPKAKRPTAKKARNARRK